MDRAAQAVAPWLNAVLHLGHYFEWGRQKGPVCPSLECPAPPVIPPCPSCPSLQCPVVAPCTTSSGAAPDWLRQLEDIVTRVGQDSASAPAPTPCPLPTGEPEPCDRWTFAFQLFWAGVFVGVLLTLSIWCACGVCRRTSRRAPLSAGLALADVETPESRKLRAELSR